MKKTLLVLTNVFLALTVRGNTIVFDTFEPGNTYNGAVGYSITGPSFEGQQLTIQIGARFTPASSGTLATIDLGLTWLDQPGAVLVFLDGDAPNGNFGHIPDNGNQTFLGSVTPSAQFPQSNSYSGITSFTVANNILVEAGINYWLVVKPANAFTGDVWNWSSSTFGVVAPGVNDPTWSAGSGDARMPAFRITAAPLPEPGSSLALMLGALAAIFLFVRWSGYKDQPLGNRGFMGSYGS